MLTGIVLGAGGAFGWAWHLGVMRAIHHAHDLEIRDARVVVGTSAGAAMAVSLSSGATVEEILEVIVTPPDEETMREMQRLRGELRSVRRWLRPMAPGLLIRPGPMAGVRALIGLLPAGPFPTRPLRRFPAPQRWPQNLVVTAVSLEDGRRVAWDHAHGLDLHDAMEASAAVPAMFAPRPIGAERFVDGAVASATNADLLVGRGLRRAIISSTMTQPGRGLVRLRSRRQLDDEVAQLRSDGVDVVVVEPTSDVVALAKGYPRTNREIGPQVVARAEQIALEALLR